MKWTGLAQKILAGASLGLLRPGEAVNRDAFKTCTQATFCARQRKYAEEPGGGDWLVPRGSVTVSGTKVTFPLIKEGPNGEGGIKLATSLTIYEGGIVRWQVDEPDRRVPRYRVPKNDVVLERDLEELPLQQQEAQDGKDDGLFSFTAGKGVSVEIRLEPFMLTVIREGTAIIQVNSLGFLNVESSREGEAESFGRWVDTQPYGRQSLAVDVAFLESTHLMGIPEHATSVALKPTRILPGDQSSRDPGPNGRYSEPYRLYNLDVFEYELDNPMALYGSIPVMLAHRAGQATSGKGIFWNNPSETWVDVLEGDSLAGRKVSHFISEAGVIDLFIFVGPTLPSVIGQYYRVTGAPYLPPLFSIAYHQCRWNYMSEEDLLEVNRQFDQHQIPMDTLWLDIEHTEGKKYFSWNRAAFPDPARMIDALTGRWIVLIVDPHIKEDGNYPLYSQLSEDPQLVVAEPGAEGNMFKGDCWPGRSIWPDFANRLTRIWWRKQFALGAHPGQTDRTFTWNDMNEPSVFSGPETTMPKDLRHMGGTEEHRVLHNLYGHYMMWATHEGLLQRQSERKRPFVLTRAVYAGSQRYGAKWTGDNRADWGHLAASVPMLLSLSLAGMPFVGADVGGFFGDPEPELLARWYQVGALQPFFRAHAHIDTKRREPWLLPEPYFSAAREAIRLRYRLLPYIYSLFAESSRAGRPIVR